MSECNAPVAHILQAAAAAKQPAAESAAVNSPRDKARPATRANTAAKRAIR